VQHIQIVWPEVPPTGFEFYRQKSIEVHTLQGNRQAVNKTC